MPAKNHLSQDQKERLLRAMRENENPQIRERFLILLLMNDGKTYQEIANFLGISYPTVAYWGVHGDPDKMESFADGRSQGNFRKATAKYEEVLLELVEKEPLEYGYEFGRWTANRLATYLEQVTGIKLSGSQVRRILERKKYVYLWAKYSLEDKQNPDERKAFKEKLAEYLKISTEAPERLQVWFWDESGFSLRVIRRKTWAQKGSRKKVTGQRRRGRVNIMGGLRYNDSEQQRVLVEKPRVFVDFHNADTQDRLRLNCIGTIEDLSAQKIELQTGQHLILYSEDLEVDGIVEYSQSEHLWVVVIDWDEIREVEEVNPLQKQLFDFVEKIE